MAKAKSKKITITDFKKHNLNNTKNFLFITTLE